jgi:hypothetical protein
MPKRDRRQFCISGCFAKPLNLHAERLAPQVPFFRRERKY